jgi:hypothetical protein
VKFGLNRASCAYLCIFAVFAVGIWAIIAVGGAYLTAPRDLSGKWRLEADSATEHSDPVPLDAFTVDQSGKYLRFTLQNNANIDVIMTQSSNAPGGANWQSLSFEGQGWHVTGSGPEGGNELDFKFQPPGSQQSPPSGTYRRDRIDQTGAAPAKTSDHSAH